MIWIRVRRRPSSAVEPGAELVAELFDKHCSYVTVRRRDKQHGRGQNVLFGGYRPSHGERGSASL